MPPRPSGFDARLGIAEHRLDDHATEIDRLRAFRHLVENDRSAMELAIQSMNEMRRRVPEIATAAANRAVEIALRTRDDDEREEREDARGGATLRIQIAGLVIALSGWLYALAPHFFR